MDDLETYRNEMATAKAEMESWLKKNFTPMQDFSSYDAEDEVWRDSDAEIDVVEELTDEFSDKYDAHVIDTVAGELICDYGDWGDPQF
ncbi:hypothetical protein JTY93_18710 [Pseudomonas hygromyciniae]|uniref:Uncharacterized protein n=1 Tax=Pseudomonas hygromyciniae TaxID=2812000 RepID=A0ABX7JUQ6_9PSED|nr:hypothetical protein [Pseudomonas hygromyciniae]MBN0978114.1 hypothetical protein [Pseudomonas hygromyciniae]QSB38290.1 hypothetical protein JTY93_18710 [Pseudomonas hygromyciniae]